MIRKNPISELTEAERRLVASVLDFYITAARKGRFSARQMARAQRLPWIVNQIQYWTHVVSGLTWVRHSILPAERVDDEQEQEG